jgi:capsular polysaccharide biosynthesis protein
MKCLLEFVTNANHTNVILISAPHRYDLMSNSCANVEAEKFNRKLCKSLERFRKVEMIEVVSERNLYTKHDQHLNSEGKESMARKIASSIECLFNKKVEPILKKKRVS